MKSKLTAQVGDVRLRVQLLTSFGYEILSIAELVALSRSSCDVVTVSKLVSWLSALAATAAIEVVATPLSPARTKTNELPEAGVRATLRHKGSANRGIEYYVSPEGKDTNKGSAAHPWATIQHAASVIGPGAVVHVAPGTYTGGITTAVSGTAKARIRFIADLRWRAKIVSPAGEAVWLNKGSYVDIEGFEVTGTARIGIENLGSHVRIVGNHVHDVVAACDSNGGAGIDNANYSASDDDVIGNLVHDVRQAAGCSAAHGQGIYQANLGGHVWNNIAFRNGVCGIQLWHAANQVTISGNTVFNNSHCGILVGAGDAPGGVTADNVMVSDNICYSNQAQGIVEFGATGKHNQYLNNLVFGNSPDLVLQNGLVDVGTVRADPQFVRYTGGPDGDYHLQATSPAIDRGTSTGAPSTDFDGGSRPMGAAWDIGAYEAGATPAAWPWP